MISYRCDNLNIELKSVLTPQGQSQIFTQAETDLEIKLLEPLEEPQLSHGFSRRQT